MKTITIFPLLLRKIPDAPKKLYYRGNLKILEKTCIAVVGTRKYTDYGEEMTKQIVRELSVLDIAIVSGLAKGIDTIAHKAALENRLPTIAVLGSGINNIYPRENQKLAEKIEENNLILSEYPDDAQPLKQNFPLRNRIISGLSIATIVIEAPEKSGALITARYALEQGREVHTVPGDIDRENSIGPLRIIQRGGAYPISSGKDTIELLKEQPHLFKLNEPPKYREIIPEKRIKPVVSYNLTEEEQRILSAIPKYRHVSMDKVQTKTALATQKILTVLSILEIRGFIKTKDGKYCRT